MCCLKKRSCYMPQNQLMIIGAAAAEAAYLVRRLQGCCYWWCVPVCEIVQIFFDGITSSDGTDERSTTTEHSVSSCYNTEANCEFGSRKNYRAREYTSEVWKEEKGFANNRLFGKKSHRRRLIRVSCC